MEGSNNKLIDDSFTCQKENGRLQRSDIKKNVRHYCKILFTYMLKSISFEIHIPLYVRTFSHFLFQCYQFMIDVIDKSQVWMINRVLNITQTSTKSIFSISCSNSSNCSIWKYTLMCLMLSNNLNLYIWNMNKRWFTM